VRGFAESGRCRHLQICTHFGQTPKWESCGMCDVCGNVPAWITAAPAEEPGVKKKKKRSKAKAEPPPPRPVLPRPSEEVPVVAVVSDGSLLQFLKEWRRRAAQKANVPAYIILSDAALSDLCRKQPTNLRELLGVTGIGERKAELYGSEIFSVFEAYRKGARAAAAEVAQVSPAEETMRLLAEGRSFEEIAQLRGRQLVTVVNMVADLVEKGRLEYRIEWVGAENHRRIAEAVERLGSQWLKPLREALPADITYEQIRLVVASVRSKKGTDAFSGNG
jgi:ATP-dependent DNA helicase RecQ